MKLLLKFLLLSGVLTMTVMAQNLMSVSFTDTTVTIRATGKTVSPGFTPGNHHGDKFLFFKKRHNRYQAMLPDFQRGMSSGKFGSIIYQISSGVIPAKLSAPLTIKISIPSGKVLVWGGKIWRGKRARLSFPSYFVAREFPIILINKGKYLVRATPFNRVDHMDVVYAWDDSSGKAALTGAFQAVDTAAANIGEFAPTYWHRYIQDYNGRRYLLTYFITAKPIVTGLEHYNSPYIITTPKYIREDGVFHTLFHSLVGKAIIPRAYRYFDGGYQTSDILGLYEGLTTYLSTRYVRNNFASVLSAMLYRARLRPDLSDLRMIGFDQEWESYYSKAYLFWLYLEENGLNVELFSKWLFSIRLINQTFPVQAEWPDLIGWLNSYDKRIGQLAERSSRGAYLDAAFRILREKGWQPIPLKDMPAWYDLYIGPYSVRPGRPQLPTDIYPATSAYPAYLLTGDSKLKIEPDRDNAALRMIKDHPDSLFNIEFSDGIIRQIRDKLSLGGEPYFMDGTISIDKNNERFWHKLNVYLK